MKAAGAFLAALLLLAGCAPAAPSHAHELTIAIPFDPGSLSPLIAFDQDQIALDLFWCQTLVGLDEHNRTVPVLVTRVPSRANGDVSPDGLRITYHLRHDVRFADGVPLTSADVAFTYHAVFDPANAAVSVYAYQRIAALTTPDPHTVIVRLRAPWNGAVNELFAQGDTAYGILPKHAFTSTKITGSTWDQQPFGSGPFRVTSWQRGDRVVLAPNPFFSPKPKLDRLVIRFIPTTTTAFDALQTHDVDATELDVDTIAPAAALPSLRIARTPENGLTAIYFQTTAAPTNDVRVRRAIADALDPATLSKAWHGVYPAARSVFPAPVVFWSSAPHAAYAGDPVLAARELDAAGWRLTGRFRANDGHPMELVIACSAASPLIPRIAVNVQEQLARLGIDAIVKTYPSNLFASPTGPLRTGHFSIVIASLIGGSDPEASLNVLCAQAHDGGENYARFCSPALDAAYLDQQSATTEAQRHRDFDTIATIVHDEVPLVPLYDLIHLEGVNRNITGYQRNMLRFPVHPETWDAP